MRPSWLSSVTLALIFFLGIVSVPHRVAARDQEIQEFSGTWSASGSQEPLDFGAHRQVALFRFSGHVNLASPLCGLMDYWAECIGLSDSESGVEARCVWRSTEIDQEIYLELHGDRLAEGTDVAGTISGGTGLASAVTGNLRFRWTSLSLKTGHTPSVIGGFTRDLEGTYRTDR